MPFPQTNEELLEAGYSFRNHGRCKGCGADIEWWRTPREKVIPLDAGTFEPHWGTCPEAESFRRKRA